MTQSPIFKLAIAGGVVLLIIGAGVWFLMSGSPTTPNQTIGDGTDPFGVPAGGIPTGTPSTNTPDTGTTPTIDTPGETAKTKIFLINAGPVVGSTLIQVLRPTTTLARFIRQEDGHVFDLPLDVAGVVPRVVSNVTIPGGQRVLWVDGGNSAIMQYLDGSIVKSVFLGFPAPTTTNTAITQPTRIVFLPDSIADIAVSPDGKNISYLLKSTTGADGYISKPDGTNGKKVYSLPLSQILITWPSNDALLAQTKSAFGVTGMVFSVDVKSGAVTSLVAGEGITAIADKTFSKIVYQTSASAASSRATYVRDVKTGANRALSFDPYPEKCLWTPIATSTLYCAAPLSFAPAGYLDLWYQGAASLADALLVYNVNTGKSSIAASPGSNEGGVASDILELAISPNQKYISFTAKGSRAVWGIRLGTK